MPWRAGANETTTITFSHDVKLEGKDLQGRDLWLFLDLDKSGPWQLDFFQQRDRLGRLPVRSEERCPARPGDAAGRAVHGVPDLRLRRTPAGFRGGVSAMGEQAHAFQDRSAERERHLRRTNPEAVAVVAGFQLSGTGKVRPSFARTTRSTWRKRWSGRTSAIKEPFRGIGPGQEDFSTLQTKAAVLTAMGRDAEADTTMEKAMHLPTTEASWRCTAMRWACSEREKREGDGNL